MQPFFSWKDKCRTVDDSRDAIKCFESGVAHQNTSHIENHFLSLKRATRHNLKNTKQIQFEVSF